MSRLWVLARPFVAMGIAVSLLLVPLSVEGAYSGQQTYRDESGSCCWAVVGTWTAAAGSNGFDDDSKYINYSPSNNFRWFSQPTPSPSYECPVVHIPAIDQANATVEYSQWHLGYKNASRDIDQQYTPNFWEPLTAGNVFQADYVEMTNVGGDYEMAADVVSFHYDSSSNYTKCSF
jgi:hypothetical protein